MTLSLHYALHSLVPWSSSPLVTGREGSLWKRYGSGFGLFEATRLEGEGYEIGDCPSLIYSSEALSAAVVPFLERHGPKRLCSRSLLSCQSNGGLNRVLSNRTYAT